MPWVRKYPRSTRVMWIGIVGGVVFGLLLGYERWGSTAAVVSIVEKELSKTEARIADAENRLMRLEAKLLSQENNQPAIDETGSAAKVNNRMNRAAAKGASNPTPQAGDTR
ncbi:MAG: hypothetical protein ACM37Z_20565 [Deltaproteobacteria bacterium]|jgi:hypothetical protein